ncbi:MAG: two-component sensor histidine kinase [Cytophagaceae bacterium]|nr:two-component sensor histidine kinase [Cytophagaceae bacterium]
MRFLKKHSLLIVSLLLLGLGWLMYLTIERGPVSATETQYLTSVQQHARDQLSRSEADLLKVQANFSITADSRFIYSPTQTEHPFFIFRNGKIFYWSDHLFVPEYRQVRGNYRVRAVDWEGNRFLVNRVLVRQKPEVVELFSLIPIYHNYRVDNQNLTPGYNTEIFPIDPQSLSLTPADQPHNLYSARNEFLFSLNPPRQESLHNQSVPNGILWVGVLAVVLMGAYVLRWVPVLGQKRHYEVGFGLLAAYLLLVRAVMLFYGIPFTFGENELFNPAFYASSVLSPSLGDLLLNALVVTLLLLYIANYYFRSRVYRRLVNQPRWVRIVLVTILTALSYLVYEWVYQVLNNLYINSSYALDLKLSLYFYSETLKIACLGVFILVSIAYFLALHLLASVFIRLRTGWLWGLLSVIMGTGLGALFIYLLGHTSPNWPLFALNGGYFVLLCLTWLPRSLYSFRYQTSIYFFTGAIVAALIGANVVHIQELGKDLQNKQIYGEEYLAENDKYGEFLINQMNQEIRQDTAIRQMLRDSTLSRERVQQRVKQAHLKNYFDNYDVEVSVFNAAGSPLDNSPNARPMADFVRRYQQSRYRTQYPSLYFVNEPGQNFIKEYVDFVIIDSTGILRNPARAVGTLPGQAPATLGAIVLDLKLRDAMPKRVYSELPVDVRQQQIPEVANEYSHAIYDVRGRLLSSVGAFNYRKKLPAQVLNGKILFEEGVELQDFRHLGITGENGRRIVVSSEVRFLVSMHASFSFLFLILVVFIIGLIIGYAVRYGFSTKRINFATKIQIYLHIAFLLPLLLVVGIAMSIIGDTLLKNQEKSYLDQTRNVSTVFAGQLDAYGKGTISRGYLEQEVKKLGTDAGRDVSLFDATGRLMIPSQPEIYEKGLLSRYINPEAYAHIIEDREHEILLSEALGSLNYKTAYMGLNAPEGSLLGVVSVPFYESAGTYEKQILDVVGSILNTFTSVFLVLLALSYLASRALTVPLRLITQKIRRTNLDKLNEPLKWKSDDEIGLLIGEYNKMLVKLEDNKQALSQSEKQSAWREMAKQVAHEIKNPLTPMKLTLQQLQRTLPTDPATKRTIDRAFNSLIDQIDNISDIANSFSDFAKMPVPKNELFDLVPVVTKTVDLYVDDRSISLQTDIRPGRAYVLGDRQLMSRTITNLIINAIQAVPVTRKPELKIKLYSSEDFVVLEVIDNGSGIPEAIRQKVFMPNFSTKNGGNGVGLAVAKRGIEHASGSIWFETEEGQGTTFYVSLPLADVKQPREVVI